MKATELRIGNWVHAKGINVDGEVSIDILRLITDGKGKDYKPIPLTEEWLEKFGFEEKRKGRYVIMSKYIDDDTFIDWDGDGSWGLQQSDDWVTFPPTIKYIHQLQNLYFALTGEELKYAQ